MKKIALISSFCDTEEKIEILVKNITKIKSLGLDIMLMSPLPLDQTIINKCDYYFQTKDNPVLDWPNRAMLAWKIVSIGNLNVRISRTFPDYGWAGLLQVKQLSSFALQLNYDYFYHMIYDLKIDDTVIEGINSTRECSIYPSRREETVWEVGLHFMIFNRSSLEKFYPHITLESYQEKDRSDAFVWLGNLKERFDYQKENTPVEDEIYYYSGHDFFNYSPVEKIKFFISKNYESGHDIKIVFYNLPEDSNVIIYKEGKPLQVYLEFEKIVNLGFDNTDIKKIEIEIDGEIHDLTETIKGIKHSILEIL